MITDGGNRRERGFDILVETRKDQRRTAPLTRSEESDPMIRKRLSRKPVDRTVDSQIDRAVIIGAAVVGMELAVTDTERIVILIVLFLPLLFVQ